MTRAMNGMLAWGSSGNADMELVVLLFYAHMYLLIGCTSKQNLDPANGSIVE